MQRATQYIRDVFQRTAYDPSRSANSEPAQALIRAAVAPVVLLAFYFVDFAAKSTMPMPANLTVQHLLVLELFIAWAIAAWVVIKPETNHLRRIITMVNDYVMLALVMTYGGPAALPTFVLLLWVTIGNGMRFGRFYLAISSMAAIATLGVVYANSPDLQEHGSVALTLLLVLILVPVYTSALIDAATRANQREVGQRRARAELLAVIGAQMRSPLASIIGLTSMLRPRVPNDGSRALIDVIASSSKGLLHSLGDVMDIAGTDANPAPESTQDFLLDKVFTTLIAMFSEQVERKQLTFDVSTGQGLDTLFRGNANRITQVLINLISSSIRFTPEGGRIHLEVEAVRRNPTTCEAVLRFQITDTGPGIPAHIVDSVLRNLTAVDHEWLADAGLGISVSNELVRLMGSQLRYTPGAGGASFSFDVPLTAVSPTDTDPAILSPLRKLVETHRNEVPAMNVLIIDDQRSVVNILSRIVTSAGHTVRSSLLPEHALDRMKDEHFDVIIADVHMPGLNGLQLLRDAKAEGVLQPRTSIIIITGDRTPSTRDEASSIGAIAVMPKPPVASDLLDALRAASESNRGISAN